MSQSQQPDKNQKYKLRNGDTGGTSYLTLSDARQYVDDYVHIAPEPAFSHRSIWEVSGSLFDFTNAVSITKSFNSFLDLFQHKPAWNEQIKDMIMYIIKNRDLILYYENIKMWFVWDGKRNKPTKPKQIIGIIKQAIRFHFQYLIRQVSALDLPEKTKILKKLKLVEAHLQDEPAIKCITNMLARQQSIIIQKRTQLNLCLFAINCSNGAFGFVEQELPVSFPPHPTHRFTNISYEYDPNAPADESMWEFLLVIADKDPEKLQTLIDFGSQSSICCVKSNKSGIFLSSPGNTGKTLLLACFILIMGEDRFGRLDAIEISGPKSKKCSLTDKLTVTEAYRFWSGVAFDEIQTGNEDKQVSSEKLKDLIGAALMNIAGKDEKPEKMVHDFTVWVLTNPKWRLYKDFCDPTTLKRINILFSRYSAVDHDPKTEFEIKKDHDLEQKLQEPSALKYLQSLLINNLNNMFKRPNLNPYIAPSIHEYTKTFLTSICPELQSQLDGLGDASPPQKPQQITPKSKCINQLSKLAKQPSITYKKVQTKNLLNLFNDAALEYNIQQIDAQRELAIEKAKEAHKMVSNSHQYKSDFGRAITKCGAKSEKRGGLVSVPEEMAKMIEEHKKKMNKKNKKRPISHIINNDEDILPPMKRRNINEDDKYPFNEEKYNDNTVIKDDKDIENTVNNDINDKKSTSSVCYAKVGSYTIYNGGYFSNAEVVAGTLALRSAYLGKYYELCKSGTATIKDASNSFINGLLLDTQHSYEAVLTEVNTHWKLKAGFYASGGQHNHNR